MAETGKPSGAPEAPKPNPASQGNPALRMLGLPRIRARLPSRNWSIFWGVLASFSAAVIYDRRHKKQAQQKWCDAVAHLSHEPMDPSGMPRKLTIFLAAPPGDSLRPSREYFQEYVRPILVAAAVDWDVVEGRKEGDVRARLAERIRLERRRTGEGGPLSENEEDVVKDMRERNGIQEVDARGGDLVIGRHTWKEYMRGLHEGYLGPVSNPNEPAPSADTSTTDSPEPLQKESSSSNPLTDLESITGPSEPTASPNSSDDESSPTASGDNDGSPTAPASTDESKTTSEKDKKPDETPKKPIPPPAYISTASYPAATLPSSSPSTFAPTVYLDQPHLLGIINTPARTARFLNRRTLAEATGAEVASLLLFSDTRPFSGPAGPEIDLYRAPPPADDALPASSTPDSSGWEQAHVGAHAERDWHKTARAPRPEGVEPVWQDPVVVDARIGERMRVPVQNGTTQTYEQETHSADEETKRQQPRPRDWTGGADTKKVRSWPQWFVYVTGFEDEREPRGTGAKDGWVGGEDD